MTRDDIATERALKLHDLAFSLLRVKWTVKLDGLGSIGAACSISNGGPTKVSLKFGPNAACYRWSGSAVSRTGYRPYRRVGDAQGFFGHSFSRWVESSSLHTT